MFEVAIIGELPEADETFSVNLSNVFGAQPYEYYIYATIPNDDPALAPAAATRSAQPKRSVAPTRLQGRRVQP